MTWLRRSKTQPHFDKTKRFVKRFVDNGACTVKYAAMLELSDPYLNAAAACFVRQGIKRTTMSDIAGHAGVSRQALYGHYSSKSDIIVAVIDALTDRILTRVTEDWRASDDLSVQLDAYFERAVLEIFRLVQSTPEAGDILTDSFEDAAARAAERAAEARKAEALERIMIPHAGALAGRRVTPAALARFVATSAGQFKIRAQDEAELTVLLSVLKASVLALTRG